jgi:hypothetical protein
MQCIVGNPRCLYRRPLIEGIRRRFAIQIPGVDAAGISQCPLHQSEYVPISFLLTSAAAALRHYASQ